MQKTRVAKVSRWGDNPCYVFFVPIPEIGGSEEEYNRVLTTLSSEGVKFEQEEVDTAEFINTYTLYMRWGVSHEKFEEDYLSSLF